MTELKRHSFTAIAAYHDLVSLLLDEASTEIRGTPTIRERGGRKYWYDRYRIGTATQERYLGEDDEAFGTVIANYRELVKDRGNRLRERTRLVRLLRSERFLGTDAQTGSLLNAFAKTGVFRLGGVLVGTHAFRIYEGELGLRLTLDQTATTQDIDIASFEKLSLALSMEENIGRELENVFRNFDFAPAPGPNKGKVWRWRQSSRGDTYVEFLTPSFREDEDIRDLPALGVSAQSLHHLNYLISEPIYGAAIYRDGILVKVPRPERFAIHKLIVADRRRSGQEYGDKSRKDLMQAELLIAVLAEDRPGDLAEAYRTAVGIGPKWRKRLEGSLEKMPNTAEAIRSSL